MWGKFQGWKYKSEDNNKDAEPLLNRDVVPFYMPNSKFEVTNGWFEEAYVMTVPDAKPKLA